MTSKMKTASKNEDDLKIEDDIKNEDDLKNKDDLNDEDDLKNEDKQKRRHFHAKMTRANFTCILEWGQGSCKKSGPYPARAYTTLVVLVPLGGGGICPYF